MLDDGTVAARRDPVRRTPTERAAIVAETYEPGAGGCGRCTATWDCGVAVVILAHGSEAPSYHG
ncbi:hypothetical protein [Ascidiaceihabitans sp.]|uniref:hypothetical protein n=1 Tax=Ascidiaceihabitans sp. TaxID=1872644 RepID=UPI003299683C